MRSFSLNEDLSTIDRPKHSNSDEDFDDDDIDDNIGIKLNSGIYILAITPPPLGGRKLST